MTEFRLLRRGDRGTQVQLLQLGLTRAGFAVKTDGIFGEETERRLMEFQKRVSASVDGIAGAKTWEKIKPYLVGYTYRTIRRGDTLYKIAMENNSSVELIEVANRSIDPLNLRTGEKLTVPFNYPVVPTDIAFTSTVLELTLEGIGARYPFVQIKAVGRSVMGKKLYAVKVGTGERQVFYNASHHGNEWITTPVLMKFLEEYAHTIAVGGRLEGENAWELYRSTALYIMPMVNPDGVDLVTGELSSGDFYDRAVKISRNYPDIPFPNGWKANISGIDTNLQYPAGWENAKKIKFAQGYISPAPRDYVGEYPLQAPESRAVFDFTISRNFSFTLSYHTQGEVIFWQYLDFNPPGAYAAALEFSRLSGYAVADVPYASGFAGYKDWFIYKYNRPGYTIEAGKGISPLPLEDFDGIYKANRGILISALAAGLQ